MRRHCIDMARVDDRDVDGVSLYIYHSEGIRHRPHLHAYCGGDAVVLSITSGQVIAGKFPKPQLRKVLRWLEVHRDEAMERLATRRTGAATHTHTKEKVMRRRCSAPILAYVQRLGGNRVRLCFIDGMMKEIELPISGRPKRLQMEPNGMGLRFAPGGSGEYSAYTLYHYPGKVIRKTIDPIIDKRRVPLAR